MVAIFYLRWSSNEQRQCQAKCCLSSVLCSTWNYTLLVIASSRGPMNALNSYRIATSKKNYSGYEQLSSFLDELFIIQIPNMSLSSNFNQLASSGVEPETLQLNPDPFEQGWQNFHLFVDFQHSEARIRSLPVFRFSGFSRKIRSRLKLFRHPACDKKEKNVDFFLISYVPDILVVSMHSWITTLVISMVRLSVVPRFEPRAAGWEARMLQLPTRMVRIS